ncbi:hypothetical protein CEXT_369931 [Caerostris extrusa]|uniref:Uncharacterized protein n=1 Tax=Caerostris extrusa TaxID=172846 RepID=A0AAV4UPB1_CAEEX|nr:hypothetical protein CEXT_369931 [Caerostris extrusa]
MHDEYINRNLRINPSFTSPPPFDLKKADDCENRSFHRTQLGEFASENKYTSGRLLITSRKNDFMRGVKGHSLFFTAILEHHRIMRRHLNSIAVLLLFWKEVPDCQSFE